MPLAAGTRLGPYEIGSMIGSGSMGEVYRARDLRLRRDVALKVLPVAFATDDARLRRFEQEALAAAALNHPNILTVYDIGADAGTAFVVAELLQGRTLRDALQNGPLPAVQAIDYARQIAAGLAAAHEQGIVHRDVKPENVFVTHDGRVKLLDFGIARIQRRADNPGGETVVADDATEPGMVLGTIGYMAPEQVRGQPVDHRADIFALGCVFYEMLAGRRAFTGPTAADTMTAILAQEPAEIEASDASIDQWLRRIVKHCLEKTTDRRFQSARDFLFTLEAKVESATTTDTPNARRRGMRTLALVLLAALAGAGAVAAAWMLRRESPPDAFQFDVTVPRDMTFAAPTDVAIPQLAISPDGRALAFVAEDGTGRTSIWIRRLNSTALLPVPGTQEASFPFWAPDSRQLGFFSLGKLRKVDTLGGAVQVMADAAGDPRGGTWAPDGTIVFAPGNASGLLKVSAFGGTPTKLLDLAPERGESGHRWPHFLPDGRHFLYQSRALPEHRGIYIGSVDGTPPKRVLADQTNAVVSPDGYLIFVRASTLMAQRIDLSRLELEGEAVALVDRIGYSISLQYASLALAQTGTLVYGLADATSSLTWFDRLGKQLGTVWDSAEYLHPRLSPDGRTIAVARREPQQFALDLWSIDTERRTPTRLTSGPTNERFPVWSPDGNRLAFASLQHTLSDIFVKSIRSDAAPEPMLTSNVSKFPTDWSADNRWILYHGLSQSTGWDLFILDVASRKPSVFLSTPFNEFLGQFSPDGRWLAYVSDESGSFQVYVQPFPATGERWQISTAGGMQPRWRRDSREILFIARDRKLVSVSIETRVGFRAEPPRPLFETRVPSVGAQYANDYAVSPDGSKFLINTRAAGGEAPPIKVITWWRSLLTH